MQFSKIFIAAFLATTVATAPLAAPQNDVPPFRVQDPANHPIHPEPEAQHDGRNFVFNIPIEAEGKICTPYLGAGSTPETGDVKLFTLIGENITVHDVEQRALNQHIITFGLFEDGTTPTIQTFGPFSFPCVPGTTVAFRFDGAGSTLHLNNDDGRFVLSTTYA